MDLKWKIITFFETSKHKYWVAWYMLLACIALLKRAIIHDFSKYSMFEAPYIEQALPKLLNVEYGSDDYKIAIKPLDPALSHHYKKNSHHPEYYNGKVEEMSPLDQIEMLCDWRAASRRHKTGSMTKSLKINKQRFEFDHCIYDSLERDANEIGLL